MLIYLDELGNVAQSVTEPIGRNSNDASVIYVVSYFPAASIVYMTFTLPNGKALFGGLADGATGEDLPQTASCIGSIGEGMTVWRYTVPQAVTALSGVVSYTIYAQNGGVRSSAAGTFVVAYGSRITLPEIPGEDAWYQMSNRLSTAEGDIDELIDVFNGVERRLQAVENPTGDVAEGETKPVPGGKIFAAVKDAKDEALDEAKEYADNPTGDVAEGETKPVSGGKIFAAVKGAKDEALDEAKEYADNPNGDVASGATLPVSGGKIYSAIKSFANPLEARVDALEGAVVEGLPFYFTTAEDLAVNHDVPSAALPYARLSRIGGYTKKCPNLLALVPNTELGTGTDGSAESEYHVWVDENGYLCIDSNGNDTGISSVLELPEELFKNIPNGATVSTYVRYVSGSANGGSAEGDEPYISCPLFNMNIAMTAGATHTQTETFNADWLTMYVVGVFDNLKLAVTVVEGSTAVDEPVYYEGFKSAKVTAVKSYGKNLYDGDAEITLNGETRNTILATPNIGGTTTFSYKADGTAGNSSSLFLFTYEDGTEFKLSANSTTYKHTKKIKQIKLLNWCAFVGRIYDIQLERGSTATEYKPYVGLLDTYTVPSEVQALEGYGNGVQMKGSSVKIFNTVDLGTKIYTMKAKEVVLNGGASELTYTYDFQGLHGISLTVLDGKYERARGICSHANVEIEATAIAGNMWLGVSNSNVYWLGILDKLGISSVAALKTYLEEQHADGNPVRIIYDTDNDTETDISAYIPGTVYLKVEAGGYIVAENDDGIEAPLTMTYQVKTDPTI